jgi:hypothetical protein
MHLCASGRILNLCSADREDGRDRRERGSTMRGRERICKKHIKQAGWNIANAGEQGQGYLIELHGPRGEQMKVEASTKARAYRHAERQVNGSEPGMALWAGQA